MDRNQRNQMLSDAFRQYKKRRARSNDNQQVRAFYDSVCQEKKMENACSRLWAAVLNQVVADLMLPQTSQENKTIIEDAKKWVDLENKNFRRVCQMAKVDPDHVYNVLKTRL